MLTRLTILVGFTISLWAQQTPQIVAVRAGRMFDPKSGANLTNQVILIRGDKITDVGAAASIQIPAGATVIDLSSATVLPGLIDGHVHLTDQAGGLQHQMLVGMNSAMRSLNAGYTTQVVMGSHGGGYADVEIKKGIESGLVKGPRLITAGPILNIEGPSNTPYPLEWKPFEPEISANGAGAMRAGVRELAHYGAEHIKTHTTGRFYFKPGGEMVNQGLPSLDELKAIVDEGHRRGMWTASHTYGGEGLKFAIEAGVDNIQHATAADDEDIRNIVQKKLPITTTTLDHRQDQPGDLRQWDPYSRYRLVQKTWVKMMNAGVILGWGSGAGPVSNGQGRIYNKECNCSHGVQGEMFPIFVSWGATPVYTLRMATTVNAQIIHWDDRVGTIEKGKFADLIATAGDPLQDISEMQKVRFVMKGGEVFKNDLRPVAR